MQERLAGLSVDDRGIYNFRAKSEGRRTSGVRILKKKLQISESLFLIENIAFRYQYFR